MKRDFLTHNREYWNASLSVVVPNNFYQFGLLDFKATVTESEHDFL